MAESVLTDPISVEKQVSKVAPSPRAKFISDRTGSVR